MTDMVGRSLVPLLDVLVGFAVVYVLQSLTGIFGAMGGLFVLSPPVTTDPWTVVTSVYAHGNLAHLASNAVALVLFGWPVARATTRERFHLFFLVTGAIAGVSQIVLGNLLSILPVVAPTGGVLGASGAVFALLGYLLAANRLSEGLASFVDVSGTVTLGVFTLIAVGVTMATAQPGVALVAHFSGLFVGLLAGRTRLLSV